MPKQYRGMAADVRALATYVKLLRAGEGVLRESSRFLSLYDLTPPQFGVLEALYQVGRQQTAALARRMLRTSADLNGIAESLRKRGLVRRDRRKETVTLTRKGRNLVRSVLPGHGTAIVSVMARLSPKEQETLGKLCRKVDPLTPSPGTKLAAKPRRRARSPRR